MKALLFSFVIFISLAYYVIANEEHDGNCHVDGHTIAPGESANVENPCGNVECEIDDNGHLSMSTSGCSRMAVPPEMKQKCRFVQGSGPFPDCCERLECDE